VLKEAPPPREGGTWLLAGVSVPLFFLAATPSPLYGVYQAQWRFSATTLTAFAEKVTRICNSGFPEWHERETDCEIRGLTIMPGRLHVCVCDPPNP
jgi:hypothetical protein